MGREDKAVYLAPGQIIAFGDYDFWLYNNCNNDTQSNSESGESYEGPPGIAYGTDQAKSYFAGAKNFKVREIEAFQVKFL